MNKINKITIVSAVMAGCFLVAPLDANAGDTLPAVAAPNLSLATGAAIIDNDHKFIIAGKGTWSLSHEYGAQIDFSEALGEGRNRGGIAGHLFRRDPEKYLAGVTAMWSKVGDLNITRYGLEGEYYLSRYTLRLDGGFQNYGSNSTGYGDARASYYATDNLSFSVNGATMSDTRGFGADVEWQPQGDLPFSFFASVGDTNDSDGHVMAGARFAFGAPKTTLKERHRQYDPPNIVQTFVTNDSEDYGTDTKPAGIIIL